MLLLHRLRLNRIFIKIDLILFEKKSAKLTKQNIMTLNKIIK